MGCRIGYSDRLCTVLGRCRDVVWLFIEPASVGGSLMCVLVRFYVLLG